MISGMYAHIVSLILTNVCGLFQFYVAVEAISLSLSLSVCLSRVFIFICHVMWEFWVPSPTVQAICAPLSLSNHPTNTHSCSHTESFTPTHTVNQQRHRPARSNNHTHAICIVIKTWTSCVSASFWLAVIHFCFQWGYCMSTNDQNCMSSIKICETAVTICVT